MGVYEGNVPRMGGSFAQEEFPCKEIRRLSGKTDNKSG
jgi:hypothetical protein